MPRLDELSLDARVFGFAILVALSMMLVFASVPAIQAARQDPQDGLRADGRSVTAGSGRRRVRAALTIGEVALSVALLIGAGLLMRSFARLQEVDPGFSVSGLMTARVNLPANAYPNAASRRAFYERFLDDLRGRAGIEAAAISSGPPLSGDFTGGDVTLADTDQRRGGIGGVAPGRPGILRGARHSDSRTRVHDARHDRRTAGGDHQRGARQEVLPQRRPHRTARS